MKQSHVDSLITRHLLLKLISHFSFLQGINSFLFWTASNLNSRLVVLKLAERWNHQGSLKKPCCSQDPTSRVSDLIGLEYVLSIWVVVFFPDDSNE